MKIVTDLNCFNKKDHPDLIVALGNFDGVHLGHQAIIKQISECAKQIDGTSAVFTFKEHPQRILHQKENPQILTSLIHKLYLLKRSGLDLCFLIDFTIDFSKKTPEEFVRQIFVEKLGARGICLGYNARFGHDRSGNSQLMNQFAGKYGFKFIESPLLKIGDEVVSSSTIRSFIQEGKLAEAEKLLGRPYSFFGTMVSGSGRGARLGFPTANLDPHSEVMPPEGVYAAWVRILDCRLKETKSCFSSFEEHVVGDHLQAVLNYGKRPTFGKTDKSIPEVHIFNFNRDLNEKTVEVVIGKKLRSEHLFENREALKAQIQRDVEESKHWFQRQGEKKNAS